MLNSYFTYFSDGCGQIWNVKWFWIKAILVLLQLQCIHMDDRLQSYCLLMKTKYLCLKFHLSSCFKSPMCSVQEGDNMPHLTDLILVPKLVISFKYLGVRDSGFILVSFSQCLPSSTCIWEADLLMKPYLWQSVSLVFSIYVTLLCSSEQEAVTQERRNSTQGSDINSLWS